MKNTNGMGLFDIMCFWKLWVIDKYKQPTGGVDRGLASFEGYG